MAAAIIAIAALVMQWRMLPTVPAKSHVRLTDFKAFVWIPEARKSIVMIATVFAAHCAAQSFGVFQEKPQKIILRFKL
ncbi:hypothetical protein [Acetobacter oryzifermentans]|uniref:hypothetical protein n=1 Tax=Acetobacter oryzifermentans TaxID=1633874 RepID=UPI0007B03C80|nr:hypothetical protein [Acetobacter oryzifermentans]